MIEIKGFSMSKVATVPPILGVCLPQTVESGILVSSSQVKRWTGLASQ